MRLKINLEGFLEETNDINAIPYLLKMFLKDVMDLDIKIDPKNPHDTNINSDTADIIHEYNISDTEFFVIIDYKLKA